MDKENKVQMVNDFAGVFSEALENIYGANIKAYLIAKWNACCEMWLQDDE